MSARVLAIAAHPDDIEFLMSGTLMLLGDAGYELHYLNVANGCCGSTTHDREATARIRRAEARAAAASIGAVFHESLTNDLEIFYDRPTLARLASLVREVNPSLVLTHAPADYMEDHTNCCRLAVTATFARGMPNFPVDPPRPPVGGNCALYHAQPYGNRDPLCAPVRPTHFVNVGPLSERKTKMLAYHASQDAWLDASQGLSSYLQTMHDLAREVGQMSGAFTHAEGWRRHIPMGFCGPNDDPLRAALGEQVLVAT